MLVGRDGERQRQRRRRRRCSPPAAALSLLAIGLMWYAYATFIWRMDRITARTSARVDDRSGPMILAGSLLVALLASAAVTILRGNS